MNLQPYVMKNAVLNYDWGSTTALPQILGLPNPRHEPMAELWMGAHPKAPSRLLIPGGDEISLDTAISNNPVGFLGEATARHFDNALPFLFKLLAAAKPLSIQVHPSRQQARQGYEREEQARVPMDAPHRMYLDRNHKPELVSALTPFTAMCGFRTIPQILQNIEKIDIPLLAEICAPLRDDPSSASLEQIFRSLLNLSPDERLTLAHQSTERISGMDSSEPLYGWIQTLSRIYPDEIGILWPLFLNIIELMPGQALYLTSGVLHSYLQGTGIEIMANSDNVFRGGLTRKHVDTEELLKVLQFQTATPEPLEPIAESPSEKVYQTDAEEFELSVIDVDSRKSGRAGGRGFPEILFCIEGKATIRGSQIEPVELRRGLSVFLPAPLPEISIEGEAQIYKATVGRIPIQKTEGG